MAPKVVDAEKKTKAPKGEGCEAAKISMILGLLKYQAKEGKKDPARKAEAAEALEVYQALADPTDRNRFLEAFEVNGGGKSPGSLKFAGTFSKTLTNNKKKEWGVVEDFLTRSPIHIEYAS